MPASFAKPNQPPVAAGALRSRQVRIGLRALPGDLDVPARSRALVLFAHGSGSSRLSSRNRWVAEVLQQHELSTLLFDLLDDEEAADRRKVFDIGLLSERVQQALDWTASQAELAGMTIGLFGASTGAAAALCAAAARSGRVAAVVSRGGRPDLAGAPALEKVRAPTLLLVGGLDDVVIELNERAYAHLACVKNLIVVPGASHLFEEAGTLDEVAAHSTQWFHRWLT
jgi:dienelactone hydrolase